MLKGKRVLTKNYFGTVLNDAEQEPCVILRIIRWRRISHNDTISVIAGLKPREVSWHACEEEVRAIPWGLVGEIAVYQHLPEWLYLRALRNSGGGHRLRKVKGRSYIDW